MTTNWTPAPGGSPYPGAPYAGGGWPAPAAPPPLPGPPAPRPRSVTVGVALWAVGIALSVAQSVWSLAHVDQLLADAARRTPPGGIAVDPQGGLLHDLAVAGGVFGLVWALAYAVFLALAWQGRNWARVVVWSLGGLGLFGLAGLVGGVPAVQGTLLVLSQLFTLAGIVLLALRPANDWYRLRGAQRRAAAVR